MTMSIEKFFSLFLDELRQHEAMQDYYKFLAEDGRFYFRRNYFFRRLEFVSKHIGSNRNTVWDCGCGYGTTAIFLALNGFKVRGTTLEFYFEHIEKRLKYWSGIGDVKGFTYEYKDIFDESSTRYDRIIVQDTLHHLEPLDKALAILKNKLAENGKMIAIEENGRNLFQRTKDFLLRGTKRIKEVHDERLGRTFLLGNENIRPFDLWKRILSDQGFVMEDHEFIRLFLPGQWSEKNWEDLQERERAIWRRSRIAREYLYWGVNFVVSP